MKTLKKILKMLGITIGSIILTLFILGVLFVNLSPQFGRNPSKEQLADYAKLDYHKEGKFENLGGVKMKIKLSDYPGMILKFMSKQPEAFPEKTPPIITQLVDSIQNYKDSSARIMWFGHSSFLLQVNGQNILIDPMLTEVPAPHPLLGNARFQERLPISLEDLPPLDLVLISHDHYDHLDYKSILAIKDKTKQFLCPLGVGNHLSAWGVPDGNIQELKWWDELNNDGFNFALTPAQHFSGRGPRNEASTLWGSWVIKSKGINLFFSGDSGYGDHFKEIGEKYGPFDLALMECGQYNEQWKEIHMMPEETAQAAKDVQALSFMPIHWGSFKLALHPWTEPIIRVKQAAAKMNLNILHPEIGEMLYFNQLDQHENKSWWK